MHKPNSDVMAAVVQSLCERIDSPRSLAVWLCFQYNQKALLELPPPLPTVDTDRFSNDYFISEYLSKYKGLKTRIDTKAVAIDSWRAAEQSCSDTNKRFREQQLRPFTGRVGAALFSAQRKIAAVLGRLNMSVIFSDCKWGPGATYDLCRKDATPDKKISEVISVTSSALPLLKAVIESDPHWMASIFGTYPEGPVSLTRSNFLVTPGSRLLTVPKSAKTDRCIAAEPTGNSFLQQGVHSYLRRRLARFGVDLADQAINQQRARRAYSEGLSTLDLSAASDTISLELVYHLLPLDWALFLDRIRSKSTFVDGEWVRTEKFASMGNAFCFELETLIFWALSGSVEENLCSVDQVTVFGDDIIVPRNSYDSVVELLTVCGFKVNMKKSFKDGDFFESCGKHFHKGRDITPVYQKEVLDHPSEIIRAHNRLYRLANLVDATVLPSTVSAALSRISSRYPLRPFPRVPYGVSEDGGFLRPLSEFPLDKSNGFRCHVLDFKPGFSQAREDAMFAYKLRRACRNDQARISVDLEYLKADTLSFRNADPKGRCYNVTEGKWRTCVRYVPELAITSLG